MRARTAELVHKHALLESVTGELRKEKAMLPAIIDNSPDGMALKSADGTYLDSNAARLFFVNRPREQVVGRTDADILEDQAQAQAGDVPGSGVSLDRAAGRAGWSP